MEVSTEQICINDCGYTNISEGTSYSVISIDAFKKFLIRDDNGRQFWMPSMYFKTQTEVRNEKLNLLLKFNIK